jgi:hypothetical protein
LAKLQALSAVTWTRILAFLARKGRRHRAVASVILVASVTASPFVDDYFNFVVVRYWLFQRLAEWAPARALEPRYVKVVLIGDDEYWGELEGRTPLKRDYVARLVDELAAANASAIALDLNVRLRPQASGAPGRYDEIPASYRSETEQLMRSIARAADQGKKIVLSKTIWNGRESDSYRLLPDIYQPYGICSERDRRGRWLNPGTSEFPLTATAQANITCGYIVMPKDLRLLPPRVKVDDGPSLESFALAVARTRNARVADRAARRSYYSSYIPAKTLAEANVVFSSGALLRREREVMEAVGASPVIVGGNWHKLGHGLGEIVDTYATPLGPLAGALIHHNFAEAILDGRSYRYVPKWALVVLEILFAVVAAVVFSIYANAWTKLLGFVGFSLILIVIQWLMLQLLGTFFEAFVPLLGLWLHSVFERFVD